MSFNRRFWASVTIGSWLFFCPSFLKMYTPKAKTLQSKWNLTGRLQQARSNHTATLLASGKVLIVGGLHEPNPCCRAAELTELYDPITGQCSVTNSPQTKRWDHIALRLSNGKVLIAGGNGDTENGAEIYDPETKNWSIAGKLNARHLSPVATLLADGRVLLTGMGIASNGTIISAEIYDPATNLWSVANSMNVDRLAHSANLLPDGRVMVSGGVASTYLRSVEIYDPTTNRWTLTGDFQFPHVKHLATLLANGKVLVTGGADANENASAVTEIYDSTTKLWSLAGDLNVPRSLNTLTLLPNGKAIAIGGASNIISTLNSAELYDPITKAWTFSDSLNNARRNHTATLLQNGKVLVAGGKSIDGVALSSMELFDSGLPNVTSVSAASFANTPLAPESIVAAFGTTLATSTQIAIGLPLPTELSGVSVRIKDRLGVERPSPLFFASPTQINYQIPLGTASGLAIATINSISTGTLEITSVSPGLFSADASGAGLAAAVVLRIKANGEQVYESVGQFDSATGRFVALPIDVSNPAEQVFLLLYGTGFRHHSGLNNVKVTINGADSEVLFAGAQGGFVGLDQCNVRLPNSLTGRGEIIIALTADGKTSNTVKARIK